MKPIEARQISSFTSLGHTAVQRLPSFEDIARLLKSQEGKSDSSLGIGFGLSVSLAFAILLISSILTAREENQQDRRIAELEAQLAAPTVTFTTQTPTCVIPVEAGQTPKPDQEIIDEGWDAKSKSFQVVNKKVTVELSDLTRPGKANKYENTSYEDWSQESNRISWSDVIDLNGTPIQGAKSVVINYPVDSTLYVVEPGWLRQRYSYDLVKIPATVRIDGGTERRYLFIPLDVKADNKFHRATNPSVQITRYETLPDGWDSHIQAVSLTYKDGSQYKSNTSRRMNVQFNQVTAQCD